MANNQLHVRGGIYLSSIEPNDKSAYLEHFKEKAIHDTTDNIPFPYTEADADWWIDRRIAWTQKHEKEVSFAIRQASGYLIGSVGVNEIEIGQTHCAEIGYWLAKPFWGQGIATDAVRIFIKYAFEELGLVRLFSRVLDFNAGSWRVLEKNGFQLEGILRKHIYRDGRYIDDRIYGLLKQEWTALI